ncbi:hypothetical protein ONZ45_g8296 [Pleurotus djamor]|nr:hypothetical protein ONZ45_g8296 [Pleurotus djamor]
MPWDIAATLSILYLVLYAFLFGVLIFLFATGKVSLKSRYGTIGFHVLLRLAAQSVGLAFALIGYANVGLLVAYFVLGAEGYFTLVLCAYRFVIAWHESHFVSGHSWLERKQEVWLGWWHATVESFKCYSRGWGIQWMGIIHWLLVTGNGLIVAGGNIVSGGDTDESTIKISNIMRTLGQALFLGINIVLLGIVYFTIRQANRENAMEVSNEGISLQPIPPHSYSTLKDQQTQEARVPVEPAARPSQSPHPTLLILLVVWPLLVVRGCYGLLGPFIGPFDYFNDDNYGEHGLTAEFVTYEYVMSTTMEWTICTLLVLSYWTEKRWPGIRGEHSSRPGV